MPGWGHQLAPERVLAEMRDPLPEVADTDATYTSWQKALQLPTVKGLVVGRTLSYPPDDDVVAAVDTAAALLGEAP